jgi:hypothetical protein
MVRQLENPHAGSTFGEWYRRHLPHNRTFTHISSVDRLYAGTSLEHLVLILARRERPRGKDNALQTLRAFAALIGADCQDVNRLDKCLPNTKHCMWIVQQEERFQLFAVTGNWSDLLGSECYLDKAVWQLLVAPALRVGLHPRVIPVDCAGCPEHSDDVRWLQRCEG